MSEPNVTAILLAAGRGQRVGSEVPKQFLNLAGRPMLCHSARTLAASPRVGALVVAVPPDACDAPEVEGLDKVAAVVAGGATRQDSLHRALERLPDPTDTVMVHDAARPLLDGRLIDQLLDALDEDCDGVIPAIPLEDTIKRVSADLMVQGELDRRGVWRVQTPQVFGRRVLQEALARAQAEGHQSTDCSQMLTRAGGRVRVVEGDPLNFKVTLAADLWLAEQIMKHREGAQ